MTADRGDRLPGNTWFPLAEAVTEIAAWLKISEEEGKKALVDAIRCGAVYSRGRLYTAASEPAFLINPAAWAGMDIDFAMNRLIQPNLMGPHRHGPLDGPVVVQSFAILEHRAPFLHTPTIFDLRLHRGSLRAWLDDGPRPEVPLMPPAPNWERVGPIFWTDHSHASASASAHRDERPGPSAAVGAPRISKPALREFLLELEREIGDIPSKKFAFEKAVERFADHHAPKLFVFREHEQIWGKQPPGPRKKRRSDSTV